LRSFLLQYSSFAQNSSGIGLGGAISGGKDGGTGAAPDFFDDGRAEGILDDWREVFSGRGGGTNVDDVDSDVGVDDVCEDWIWESGCDGSEDEICGFSDPSSSSD
jgi:hypothetical protein